ncbi:MAG: ABC transporter substrate-binding protein [Chloroflexi bacterium]|nr:ABC transporter substrate-binding protein [Chloroflexota bacterium]
MSESMKISRREFLRIAGPAVAGLTLAACGAPPSSKPAPPTATPQPATAPPATTVPQPTATPTVIAKPVTLRVRSFLDIKGTTPREKAFAMLVESFQKKYPNITVNVEQLPYDQLDTKLIVENEAKTAPDVSYLSPQLIGKHVAAKSLLPLDPFIARWPKSKLDEFYSKGMWNATVVDGKKYTMAIGIHTRVLYTRKDFLKKAAYTPDKIPATLDELVEMAKKTTGDGVYGLGISLGKERTTPEIYYYAVLWGFGGDLLDKDGKPVFNSEAGAKALDWLKDAVFTYKIVPESAISARNIELSQQFPEGRYAMVLDGSYRLSGWLARNMNTENMGAGPWPSNTAGKPAPMFTNSWDLGMPASIPKEKQDAAWAFIAYYFEPEISKAYTLAEGSMPALKSLLDDKEFQTPYHKVFADVIARAGRGLPISPFTVELDDLIIEAVQDALVNKTPSKTALDKAAAAYLKLIGKS